MIGAKARLGPAIGEVLQRWRPAGAPFVEPFVGTGNVTIHLQNPRYCSDINPDLIALLEAIRDGWRPPGRVSAKRYADLVAKRIHDPRLRAFIGFGCSWGGKWLGGFARSSRQNFAATARRSLLDKAPLLDGVEFETCDYRELHPEGALVYCDPPYMSATVHSPGSAFIGFDHRAFWSVIRRWSKTNIVVVSEYQAPEDFEAIATFPTRLKLQNPTAFKNRVERLFALRGLSAPKKVVLESVPRMRGTLKRLIPDGWCWCGCGREVRLGSFFAPGHDRKAVTAVLEAEYGGAAQFLAAHGYGPQGRKRLRAKPREV